jgi:hypothetical protein
MDSLFALKSTPFGGRGLYAIRSIPRDTLLLTCEEPYATVIYRKFRKEVCGHCIAYAFDSGRNAWNIRYTAQEDCGLWFCSEECRDLWATQQNIQGLQGSMNAAVNKLARTMKEPKTNSPPSLIENMQPEEITIQVLDRAWRQAEDTYAQPGYPTPYLDEMDLDVARFIIHAIIQRYLEDTGRLDVTRCSSWQDLFKLQNSELAYLRSKPHALAPHTRIYFGRCCSHPCKHT